VAEERGPRPGETSDAAGAVEPGTVSRLLREIALLPAAVTEAAWREALQPGDVVGRYQIRREIGRGGFGAVYEAFDPELGRVVALKALKPGKSRHQLSEEWIKKEAEAVAKLDHPAIVTIFDVGTCPAGAYLVMELLRGETLARRIEKGPLPVDEALRVAEQMAEGLAHAHSRGVLHRDLKPANVFLCEDGRVKLLDFGLAHLLGTEGSSGAGTPAYMAPEQAAGATVDERADVWAAGMVLGEMLTGKRPVERTPTPEAQAETRATEDGTALMWQPEASAKAPVAGSTVVGDPKLGGVPRPVARALEVALAEDPSARPRNGAAWLATLRSARHRVDRPRRVRRIAVLGGIGAVLGLAVAGFATWRLWERQIPGGRVTVAVADFVNETGEKDLDGLSGLLTTSLEQSPALRVLTRSRMFDVLKQLGKGDAERIDETLAREVGRHSRVRALLLASIRKVGDSYVVELRALDPLVDAYVFTLKDRAASKREVLDLVDRLGAATMLRLGLVRADPAPLPRVATVATANLEAWDLLFRSRRALDLGRFEEGYALAEQAAALEPDSPLVRYQLYQATGWGMRGPGRDEAVVERRAAAEAVADRLPEKERLILSLDRAILDQKAEVMESICERLTAAYPLEKDILQECGTARFHFFYADRDRALAYLERALQLDPTYELAIVQICYVLLTLGGAEEKVDLLRQRAPTATGPRQMRALALALLSAGAEGEALALLERVQSRLGHPYPAPQLAIYRLHTGKPAEAERIVRECLAANDRIPEAEPLRKALHAGCSAILMQALATQGRRAEALEIVRESPSMPPGDAPFHRMSIHASVGAWDGVRAAARELGESGATDDPGYARDVALALVESGLYVDSAPFFAVARASQSWTGMPNADRVYAEALASLAAGAAEAEAGIRAPGEHPPLRTQYDAARVLARILRDRGACDEVVAVLERSRRIPFSNVVSGRAFNVATQIHWLAECYEKLGDLAKARERNEEMLGLWARADPDLPLLADARALQARLAVK
jgi:eukaryotic-like serine/threonine-protein kinase